MREIDIAFALLRSALGGGDDPSSQSLVVSESRSLVDSLSSKDWWSLFRLLQKNRVAALASEAFAHSDVKPPREVLIPWLSERQKAERWYRHQYEVQQDIVDTMAKHGIETLVLKGTHLAQYYPVPELREFGDLDLYFYGKHSEADRVARETLKADISNNAHRHSKYNYRGVTVESHYNFVNRHFPPSNRRYEKLLKELVSCSFPKLGEVADQRSDGGVCPKDKRVSQLSTFNFQLSTFEILFILRHMAGHFAANRITLREVVDWHLLKKALKEQADWYLVDTAVEEAGMAEFVALLDAIVARRFGDQQVQYSDILSNMEHDIVYGNPALHHGDDSDGLSRLAWKIKRIHANRWKQPLVYSHDSAPALLFSSLASHSLKPRTILHKQ